MTPNPKNFLAFGISSLALSALTACGGGTPSNDEPAAPISTASAPAPTITPNADPLESSHPNSIQPETTLAITATGNVEVTPDLAIITAGVSTQADTAKKAMETNSEAMAGVFGALERAGVAQRDMQTSNFSLQPQYDYSSRDGGPPKLTGYTASNQVTVRVRDLGNLGNTMDAMVSAGGNTFSGLRFGLDDDRAAKNEARTLAIREAIARAELYADASGYNVARIVTVSENSGYNPAPVPMIQARSFDQAESTPIASGEVGYNITVNVVFELRK